MFAYYVRLAMISIRKNPMLSLLMVAAVGLGIGLCMTIVTVNYIMGKDPIPSKSADLYYVQLDSWDPNNAFQDPNEPPDQVTFIDAMALMDAKPAFRQTANSGLGIVVEPDDRDVKPFVSSGRAVFADFFAMFEVPFLYGSGWDDSADLAREQVVVLSREINERVFGGENSVGRNLAMGGNVYRVVGVMDEWNPIPKFYDLTTGPFDQTEDVIVPFNLIRELELGRSGNTNCWKPIGGDGMQAFLASECIWIQFWVELPSENDKRAYRQFIDSYVSDQKELGRFPRPMNNQLSNVVEWMENQKVVQDEAKMMLVVAVMFLAVCLLNTIGLLLSKFLGKAGEVGVRRALGASRRALFVQFLVESGCVGLVGGLLGLVVAWGGLKGILALFSDVPGMDQLVSMDWVMVATAIVLAIVSSIAAGLYPTWRACNVQPAQQLKSQ